MPVPDLSGLTRGATRLDDAAGDLRSRARRLAAAQAAARWDSPAGRVAQSRITALVHHAESSAGRLESAADTLRGHARAARAVAGILAGAEHAAAGAARRLAHAVADVL